MALLSAGTHLETQVLDGIQSHADILEASLDTELTIRVDVEADKRGGESDSDLLTPELDLCESGLTQAGNFSPVYSPQSVSSVDSGILPSVSDNDYLLTSLFGVDFSLLPPTNGIESHDLTPSMFSLSESPSNSVTSNMLDPSQVEIASQDFKMSNEQVHRNRKNAEAAKLNRQKKKQYVESLEKNSTTLKTENVILKTKCHEYQQRCQRLQSEVEYLKSVLANESALSSLIQNIPLVKEVKLSSSFSRKRSNPESKTQESHTVSKRPKLESHSGGVCLHVAKDVVSLEFCANCSKQAAS